MGCFDLKEVQDKFGFKNMYDQFMIPAEEYHKMIGLLREFFNSKGFIETPAQPRVSILAACEDPETVSTYNAYGLDKVWPLPQTGQMWLEYELLKYPQRKGVYCISTSYRFEPNPEPGRHLNLFPMFEFETHGNIEDLKKLERELVVFLGLADSIESIPEGKYRDIAKKYGVEELENKEEARLYEDYGNAFLLTDFPESTSPFFNMKTDEGKDSNKVDVIICGQETIGSAERATDVERMRDMFYSISDGGYAAKLFELFGKDRVETELNEYLSLDFIPRIGAGIGVSRLIRAMKINGKI